LVKLGVYLLEIIERIFINYGLFFLIMEGIRPIENFKGVNEGDLIASCHLDQNKNIKVASKAVVLGIETTVGLIDLKSSLTKSVVIMSYGIFPEKKSGFFGSFPKINTGSFESYNIDDWGNVGFSAYIPRNNAKSDVNLLLEHALGNLVNNYNDPTKLAKRGLNSLKAKNVEDKLRYLLKK